MTPLKAHVRNGQVVLDESADLPEGAEVEIRLVGPKNITGAERDKRAVELINANLDDELREDVADALTYQAEW